MWKKHVLNSGQVADNSTITGRMPRSWKLPVLNLLTGQNTATGCDSLQVGDFAVALMNLLSLLIIFIATYNTESFWRTAIVTPVPKVTCPASLSD